MADLLNQWLSQINTFISPWVYAPLLFIGWVLGINIVKTIVFSKLKKISENKIFPFAGIAIEAAHFPVTLLILGSGIYLLQLLIPMDPKNQQASTILVQAIVIISTILFLDRSVKEFINAYKGTEFAFVSKGILQGLVRGTVIGLGLLVFLDLIGISITPILASLGIGSLAVGLALQDTLANFFAGIYITVDKPVREGDFIRLESGEEGFVTEVGWRSTRIQMLPNNMLIVPNQKIISTVIMNYHLPSQELAVLLQVGIHYDSDLKKVEQVTTDVARHIMKTVPGGIPTFEPFIRYHSFGESSVNFTVILRAKQFVDQYLIKHEFIKALHERYKKEGIVIPYPIRTLDIPVSTFETLKNR